MRAFSLFLLSLKLDQKSLFKHYYIFVGGEGGWVNAWVGGWVKGCTADTGTNEAMDD